jgi:hypothetical protein
MTKQDKANLAITYVLNADNHIVLPCSMVWKSGKEHTLQNIDTKLFMVLCSSELVITTDMGLISLNIGTTTAERCLRRAKQAELSNLVKAVA